MIKQRIVQNRCVIILMILSLLLGNLCMSEKTAVAAGHTQSEAVNWAVAQIGKGLDYDNYLGNQCVDLIKYYYDYFGVAGYATGNANAYITNALPAGWMRVYGGYQPGDVAVWKVNHSCSSCTTGAAGHVGIITSADGTGFNAVNQNFNSQSYCTQNWFPCSALECAIRPSYTTAVNPPAVNAYFADFSQNAVWDTNAEMYIKVMTPSKSHVTSVGCYLYDIAGNLVKSYSENCDYRLTYVNYNCNVNNDMQYTLKPGTTYKFVLFAIVDGTEYKDEMRSFTTTGISDVENPVISDVRVYDVGSEGYTVSCKVTDNIGVARVQFPTWTLEGDQDDLLADWGTNPFCSGIKNGDTYTFRVNRSDHNNEYGTYRTHIYAWDQNGNSASTAVADVEVTEMTVPTATSKPEISYTTNEPNTPVTTKAPQQIQSPVTTKTLDKINSDSNHNLSVVQTKKKLKKVGHIKMLRGKRKLTSCWNYVSDANGYQIQIAMNGNFTKKKQSKTTVRNKVSFSRLKSKKTYYVRVRAYRRSGSRKIYGPWSAVKKCKTK